MLKCTYIVLLNNNEDHISYLIKSLKEINGRFKKEFIIIDDGSKDNSLNIVKSAVNDLPRTTIITQSTQGPTISINKAISLATGDYIHFIDGDEILHPDSTLKMMEACNKFGTQVACAQVEEVDAIEENIFNPNLLLNQKLMHNPIRDILLNKVPPMRNIGSSGSLIHRNLIEKIEKADNSIYSQTMSMSLRAAKYSNFVLIKNPLSYKRKRELPYENKFESYNNLRAIYNFANKNPDISQKFIPELLISLSLEVSSKKAKISYYLRAIEAKYIKSVKLDSVLKLYKNEYEKLF